MGAAADTASGGEDTPFERRGDAVTLRVRLTPRGDRDVVEGARRLADGSVVLVARVRAAPEKGRANAALEALLARAVGVPKGAVSVAAGATGRTETVRLDGDPDLIAARLAAIARR